MKDSEIEKNIQEEKEWIESLISCGDICERSKRTIAIEILARLPLPRGLTDKQYNNLQRTV